MSRISLCDTNKPKRQHDTHGNVRRALCSWCNFQGILVYQFPTAYWQSLRSALTAATAKSADMQSIQGMNVHRVCVCVYLLKTGRQDDTSNNDSIDLHQHDEPGLQSPFLPEFGRDHSFLLDPQLHRRGRMARKQSLFRVGTQCCCCRKLATQVGPSLRTETE